MGERRARWGYGYQDKVATAQILELLRADVRDGTSHFEGVRLADLQAGRVDDFVLLFDTSVQGNSIKWSGASEPMNWGDLMAFSRKRASAIISRFDSQCKYSNCRWFRFGKLWTNR
jgi:hypothetical protein